MAHGARLSEGVDEVPVLIADTGELRGKRWSLDQPEFLIGRAPDCQLVVPDRQVSRHHARIERRSTGLFLADLHSKNGTHLNGTKVSEEVRLQDGDIIQIALALKLTFIGNEATLPLSMADAAELGLGRLRMDRKSHRIWVGESEIEPPLSPPQYRLLELLYDNGDRVVSRDEIIDEVWPDSLGAGVSEQAIDALVRRLRDRLHESDPEHAYIVTVRGHGFRLDNPLMS